MQAATVNLGLTGLLSTTGARQTDFGIFGNGTFNRGQNNVGLVTNLQSVGYWSGSEFAQNSSVWSFLTALGEQTQFSKAETPVYAWAVRPGDVSSIPIPGAIWLFGSALLGLLVVNKRKTV